MGIVIHNRDAVAGEARKEMGITRIAFLYIICFPFRVKTFGARFDFAFKRIVW